MARQQLTPELKQTFTYIQRACAASRYGDTRASRYPREHLLALKQMYLIRVDQPGPGWPEMVTVCDDPARAREVDEAIRRACANWCS